MLPEDLVDCESTDNGLVMAENKPITWAIVDPDLSGHDMVSVGHN